MGFDFISLWLTYAVAVPAVAAVAAIVTSHAARLAILLGAREADEQTRKLCNLPPSTKRWVQIEDANAVDAKVDRHDPRIR